MKHPIPVIAKVEMTIIINFNKREERIDY